MTDQAETLPLGVGTPPGKRATYVRAFWQIWAILLFVIAPIVITAPDLFQVSDPKFALDFHRQYWPVGGRVLDGLSPYDLEWMDIQREIAFPYGPVAALLFVPFALLPQGVADVVFMLLCIGAVPLTLRVLGVRDWRVYGICFLWVPVVHGWTTANVSLLIGLGVALMWRYRDRALLAGLVVALAVSVKLFAWPLGIWLLATRRYAAFGYALLCGLAMNLAAWAVIGFDQLGAFVELLGLVTDREEPRSISILAVALDHGAGRSLAYALTLALAAAAGCACIVRARQGREVAALLLCITMCFLATPVRLAALLRAADGSARPPAPTALAGLGTAGPDPAGHVGARGRRRAHRRAGADVRGDNPRGVVARAPAGCVALGPRSQKACLPGGRCRSTFAVRSPGYSPRSVSGRAIRGTRDR